MTSLSFSWGFYDLTGKPCSIQQILPVACIFSTKISSGNFLKWVVYLPKYLVKSQGKSALKLGTFSAFLDHTWTAGQVPYS